MKELSGGYREKKGTESASHANHALEESMKTLGWDNAGTISGIGLAQTGTRNH